MIVKNSINIPNGKMNYFLTVLLLLPWGNVLIDNIRSTGYRDHVIAALTRLSLQQYVPIGGMSRGPGSLFHTCFVFSAIACYISHKFEKQLLIVRKIYFTKFAIPQNASDLSLIA